MRRTWPIAGVLTAALLLPTAAEAKKVSFTAKRAGEAVLDMRALARGADWSRPGRESAVVTIRLDGRYNQDVVLFEGRRAAHYELALGPVSRGRHVVRARFNRAKSPRRARGAKLRSLRAKLGPASGVRALVLRHAPIVYGRDLREIAGRYENNRTDVPLLTYHEVSRDAGTTTIEYTVIWSNEDGGTDTPALMARWGRTSDIEWVYRVTLDAAGDVVSESYHGPNHETRPFTGARLGRHPMLVTATNNNNLLQVDDPRRSTGYRFFQDPSPRLPAGRAREAVMDANPSTYQVMAEEIIREGKVEPVASPATPEVSDLRNYLWAELDKDTTYPVPPSGGTWVGTALSVKLAGDPQWYSSHHGVPDWSIQRDDPAATTVELPPGRSPADVEAVKAVAVPVAGSGTNPAPADYRITVTSLNRGFFLGARFRPGRSFLSWRGAEVLTPERPQAVLWRRA